MMFSNRIFTNFNVEAPESQRVPGNLATQVIGVSCLLGSLISFYTVRRFGRRSLVLWGQLVVVIQIFLAALFIHLQQGWLALFTIVSFIFTFLMTVGGLHWVYLPEVLNDS
jgi:hypothetical protein